ncbi:MAG: hypothetical protein KKF50_05385 [Nanoarchaeota archaeon]|nr:hypothetical protein [Nanoarchaeota archaeon]
MIKRNYPQMAIDYFTLISKRMTERKARDIIINIKGLKEKARYKTALGIQIVNEIAEFDKAIAKVEQKIESQRFATAKKILLTSCLGS